MPVGWIFENFGTAGFDAEPERRRAPVVGHPRRDRRAQAAKRKHRKRCR